MKLRNKSADKKASKSPSKPNKVQKKIKKPIISKSKTDKSKNALKRTKTIATSIKESEVFLERQDKIAKDQKKKEQKSKGRKKSQEKSKSPVPSKKIKKSVVKSASPKKSISKSKSPQKKGKKAEDKKVKDKKSSKGEKKAKNEKKPKKEKPKKEKPATKAAHPPVIVRQPSKLPDEPKSVALKRQESKLGQPGFPTAGIIDAVFCMDTTGSMGSYLSKAKEVIDNIMKKIDEKVKGTKIDVKFGFVAYRDHPPQDKTYVTKFKQLDNEDILKKFIGELDTIPGGGGDFPEAGFSIDQINLKLVMDGLMDSAKLTKWRDSTTVPQLRYIFHICDAPPHGKQEFGADSTEWNSGCPCGITSNDIAHYINLNQIHYRLIKIGGSLDKMSQVFKGKFTNFDEQPIDSAENLEIHVTDMIMRELLPDFD